MRTSRIIYYCLICLTILSCEKKQEKQIEKITGYWEIKHVEENGTLVKEYNISTTIDYFEVRDDLSGFRKKVSPVINGKYIVSKHSSPFSLKTEDESLYLIYNINGNQFKEEILKATKTELIISNDQGFTYTYKPFEEINIQL